MRLQHNQEKHMFEIYDEDEQLMGQIGYVYLNENEIDANYTKVFPAYEGQGLASKLLGALVQFASDNALKITPTCSYVVAAFKKNPARYEGVMKNIDLKII